MFKKQKKEVHVKNTEYFLLAIGFTHYMCKTRFCSIATLGCFMQPKGKQNLKSATHFSHESLKR